MENDYMNGGSLSFNRYMVECKYGNSSSDKNNSSGFNRYMVECKSILLLSHFDSITSF